MLQTSFLIDQNDRVRATERSAMIEIVKGLAALDESKGYREFGYSSLFSYATERLKYSEGSAMRRITAARLIKEHSEILSYLETGELSLCVVVELSKIDSREKRREVLRELLGKTKREAQQVTQAFVSPCGGGAKPKAVVIKPVRRVEIRGGEDASGKRQGVGAEVHDLPIFAHCSTGGTCSVAGGTPPPPLSESVERADPMTELVYSLKGEIDGETAELLERTQRVFPGLTTNEILKRSLKELLRKHDPREREARRRDRSKARQARQEKRAAKRARRFSTATKDATYVRDEGQCTFVSNDGHRCTATKGLELDHVVPYALGGESVEENCRLLCRAHNQFAAEGLGLRWKGRELAQAV